jgi:prevent-host-death family protein
MVEDKTLEEAFKEAAAIASVVPESMQEGAFHRALDEILGDSGESSRSKRPSRATDASRRFSEVLDDVGRGGESYVVVRHGRAVATIGPTSDGTGKALKEVLRATSLTMPGQESCVSFARAWAL